VLSRNRSGGDPSLQPIGVPAWACWAVVGATLLLQLALLGLGPPPAGRPLVGDEQMYVTVAEAWAAGQPAELDPLWPPGYPAVLALWIALFGGWKSFVLLQVAALGCAAATLGRLALRLSGDARLALLAAALFALDPQVAAMAQAFWPESLHLALVLLACELALVATPRLSTAIGFGLTTAGAVLLKSLLMPVVPLLVAALLWRAPRPARLRLAVAMLSVLLALVGPVIGANHRRHGFLGIADSSGFNLLVGLTDVSRQSLRGDRSGAVFSEYRQGGRTFVERRALLSDRLQELLHERGILPLLMGQLPRQYFRLFDRESYFAAMLPGGALAEGGHGFHAPPPRLARALGGLGLAVYALLLLAAPLGVALLIAERRAGVWWLLGWLGYLLALFFFLQAKSRYRLPLLPVLDLGAAAALVTLGDHPFLGRWRAVPRALVLGGGGVSAVLLVLGFGAALTP
jgi:hypothetical protein